MSDKHLAIRKHIIILAFLLLGVIYLVRIFYLQVIDQDYKLSSQNNVLRFVTQYPARGTIFDRNGQLLVYNEAAYDLMIIPRQARVEDTLMFCELLKIDKESFYARLQKARKHSYFKSSVFLEQISKEDYGYIVEKLYKYPGFFFQSRTLRKYPQPIAAHVFGDIGEVNQAELDRDSHYRMGDYIGKSGIESFYERILRGKKGMKVVMVDVHNRDKGSYQDGRYDTLPETGKNIVLGLDAKLQEYGERLMQNKTGSIVAIHPASGEILAMVTSPGYDPNLLVGRVRGQNFRELLNDPYKPLINRAISGTYSPGSTFKMINGLVALQSGAITENSLFSCQGPGSSPIRCTHHHISPLPIKDAIEHSCNPFFWNTFRSTLTSSRFKNQKEGFEYWYNMMLAFGLGRKFNTDIPFEVAGNIPSRAYFDKIYRNSWNALTVRSLSIGQGEILLTPLQLANLAAIIGNEGYYYPPHFLRQIQDSVLSIDPKFTTALQTNVDKKYFQIIKLAMLDVFEGEGGTARYYRSNEFRAAGKTGTVQNPHGKDHSMFMAFAPFDKPEIAIAVVVENAGYGSTWAAPIASLMMELFLTDTILRPAVERRILEADFNL